MSDIALHQKAPGQNLYIGVLQLLRDAVSSAVIVKLNKLRLLMMNHLSYQHCGEMTDQLVCKGYWMKKLINSHIKNQKKCNFIGFAFRCF